MSEPIPEETERRARALCDLLSIAPSPGTVFVVADAMQHAILAERERCTKIALETVKPIMAGNFGLVHVNEIGQQIADAIRNPHAS